MTGSKPAAKRSPKPKPKPKPKPAVKPKPTRSWRASYAITPGIRRAIAAAEWISDSDQGAVKLALRMAKELDGVQNAPDTATVANSLLRILASLGLTVEGRPANANDDQDAVDSIRATVADLGKRRTANRNSKNS